MSPKSSQSNLSALGAREQTHLKALIVQALQELYLDTESWVQILMSVCLKIAEDVPYVLDIIASRRQKNVSSLDSSMALEQHVVPWNLHNTEGLSVDANSRIEMTLSNHSSYYHRIRISTISTSAAKTSNQSTYICAPPQYALQTAFTAIPPSSSSSANRNSSSRQNELGGHVILYGSQTELSRLERIMPLLVFVTCHLKLEMILYHDSFIKDEPDFSPKEEHVHDFSGRTEGIKMKRGGKRLNGSIMNWIHNAAHHASAKLSGSKRMENDGTKLSTQKPIPSEQVVDAQNRFSRTIELIESAVLSSSPHVQFPSPFLLLRLRDQEKEMSQIPIYQRQALLDDLDLAVSHPRYLESDFGDSFPVLSLRSTCNKISIDSKAGLSYLMTNNNSISGVIRHQRISFAYSYFHDSLSKIPCQPSQVITIQYYQKEGAPEYRDQSLGSYIEMLCAMASHACADTNCSAKMLDHTFTYTHGSACVFVTLSKVHEERDGRACNSNQIYMWTSCSKCHHETMVIPMSSGTWHYSFGKYLELLFYNEKFTPNSLCPVETNGSHRECLKRRFRIGSTIVSFEFKFIQLFELRVPRIQLDPNIISLGHDYTITRPKVDIDHDINELRLEINAFYCSLKQYVSCLEESLLKNEHRRSSHFSSSFVSSAATLPIAIANSITHNLMGRGSSLSSAPASIGDLDPSPGTSLSSTPYQSSIVSDKCVHHRRSTSYLTTTSRQQSLLNMLNDVMQFLGDEEKSLQREVGTISAYDLNDFRRRFGDWISRAVENVETWRKEFMPFHSRPSDIAFPEHYQSKTSLLIPDSFVMTREADPSSLIATTLSCAMFLECFNSKKNIDWQALSNDFDCKVFAFHHSSSASNDTAPHIKLKLRNKTHLMSCSVYYAREFDMLRRKCGIGDTYVQSLGRSQRWTTKGGKSKAHFFKTWDDELVIKELATKWTLVEKDALLQFAPSYFDYMQQSEDHPTLLTKIFGFYTVKMTNLSTGQVQTQDFLVMEHLFANMSISRMFDLKGVPDRHYPSKTPLKEDESAVMWDGDWVDGRYKSLLRLHGHSKKILIEAIDRDTAFLSQANVMDYSLLVGVNDKQNELIVGIVDFIGPYTYWKALEARGKITLNSALRGGKESTVLPPHRYRDRFCKAMNQNFVMVPDKWMKITDRHGKELGAATYQLPPVL